MCTLEADLLGETRLVDYGDSLSQKNEGVISSESRDIHSGICY